MPPVLGHFAAVVAVAVAFKGDGVANAGTLVLLFHYNCANVNTKGYMMSEVCIK